MRKDFVNNILETQTKKEKTDKIHCIKIKNVSSSNGTIKGVERESTNFEKRFVKHKANKSLLPKTVLFNKVAIDMWLFKLK